MRFYTAYDRLSDAYATFFVAKGRSPTMIICHQTDIALAASWWLSAVITSGIAPGMYYVI